MPVKCTRNVSEENLVSVLGLLYALRDAQKRRGTRWNTSRTPGGCLKTDKGRDFIDPGNLVTLRTIKDSYVMEIVAKPFDLRRSTRRNAGVYVMEPVNMALHAGRSLSITIPGSFFYGIVYDLHQMDVDVCRIKLTPGYGVEVRTDDAYFRLLEQEER